MNDSKHPEPAFDDQTASTQDTSFGDILSQFEHEHSHAPGETLEGTVIAVREDSVYVDIGRKMEGVIPAASLRDGKGEVDAKAGDKVLCTITGRNEEGYYELSTIKIERPKDWSGLQAAFGEHRTIAGTVTEVVKGGLRVDIGVKAFMPASRSGAKQVKDLEELVGKEIQCRITKLDTEKEDVVVDRRVVLEEEDKKRRESAFGAIQEGQVLRGTVRGLTDYGAFVDLGGVDGLLHVGDIAWTRIAKPADVLKVGDSVEVKVLKVNRDTRKISLGMKQLSPDPWTVAAEKYKPGDRVHGTVARVADFGAFITLEAGVDGLIHASEMSWTRKNPKPSDIVKPGEAVDVVILNVNPAEKRISLGLKQALGDPWEQVEAKYPVGSTAEGTVTNMANFGAFVDLGDGIEGMIHVGDITRERRLDHPKDVLKAGQQVKAQVLEIDRDKRRIRLGMKQLEPTSTDEFISEHNPGETVTGRVVEVKPEKMKVELGDGVFAVCKIKVSEGGETKKSAAAERPDLNSITAMLNAKWKQGGGSSASESQPVARAGQVRTFRIVSLDPAQKKIQLELV